MTTKFLEDVSAILNIVMPRAEARASLKGRVLATVERSEVAHLVRESLRGNREALEALSLYAGPLPAAVRPAAAAINEETDLGHALLAGQHRSPFFAETARTAAPAVSETTDLGKALLEAAGHRSPFFAGTARTVKAITEDASIPGATPGIADEIGRMPLINGDEKFHDLTRAWAMSVPFGGRRLG